MRRFFCLALTLLLLHFPASLDAHDGAHSPDMLAEVVTAVQDGNKVAITLVITGLGGPLVLVDVSAPGAQTAKMEPVYVNFAQDVEVTAVLTFAAPPPGVFTLTLDFGPIGHGAISVMPVSGSLPKP